MVFVPTSLAESKAGVQPRALGTHSPSARPPCSQARWRVVLQPWLLLRGKAAPPAAPQERPRQAGSPRQTPDSSFGKAPWRFACLTEAAEAA